MVFCSSVPADQGAPHLAPVSTAQKWSFVSSSEAETGGGPYNLRHLRWAGTHREAFAGKTRETDRLGEDTGWLRQGGRDPAGGKGIDAHPGDSKEPGAEIRSEKWVRKTQAPRRTPDRDMVGAAESSARRVAFALGDCRLIFLGQTGQSALQSRPIANTHRRADQSLARRP